MNDSPFHQALAKAPKSRRDFLWQSGGGLGGLALALMLGRASLTCVVKSILYYKHRKGFWHTRWLLGKELNLGKLGKGFSSIWRSVFQF